MDKVFLQIINVSITSGYVILFVIVARLLLKKAPRVFSYALWSVVLFRLICPFTFKSIFSLIPVSEQTIPQNIMYAQTPQVNSGIPVIDHAVNNSLPEPVVIASANPMQIWIALGEIIWLLGITVLVIYSITTAIRLYNKLKSSKLVSDNIYENDRIKTPFVFGIINPKIYLPTGLSETERAYIIKHEQTHIRRLDHIIKPVAFLVLCIHWFNPLVWIAFFLMGEDMELSCDESVIKQMGSEIKKDYSTSLLTLSAGRRIVGGCPLAFGESNTKGRIMNILNYKKPAFWVVIAAVIVVVILCIGLMSNPQKEQLTIEDYADLFVQEQIDTLGGWEKFKIIDSKITKLEKIAGFDNILKYPIEIWSLEYRLKPDDISKVMLAGGMNEIDGWITEDTSMGKPVLVFSYENSKPQYLGCTWTGENDFTTISGQEMAIRIFLEGIKLLPNETYTGNHIVVKFPISTGETCQLFLSQPVVQGDAGIWCAERWMDGNGAVYYIAPKTDGLIADYYEDLQKQCDEGHKPSLLDPLQVSLDWINNDLGQRVSLDELVPQYSAKVEDFLKTPESHFIGYISDFEIDKYSKSSFHLDPIEWLTLDDTKRLNELNINPDTLPNGYYIHNPNNYPMFCQVTEQTQYSIINWDSDATHKSVTMEEFLACLEKYSESAPPFRIVTKDGFVQSITEQYIP
ncbi:MAG: M56 family metallopeptidase [Eubacteriales bacterium]|nr:M56 family metallopeptidase [Eubacteriales bacterium]